MSFASEYTEAYRLLRGTTATRQEVAADQVIERGDQTLHLPDTYGVGRLYQIIKMRGLGRVKAAIYAFKMVRELRRQKILMNVLFSVPEDAADQSAVQTKHIHLFPVTVNRTVVQMTDTDRHA